MSHSHSPGPWKAPLVEAWYGNQKIGTSKYVGWDIIDADGVKVAGAVHDDDARLIAAAPEMLELLRRWLRVSNTRDVEYGGPTDETRIVQDTNALLSRIEGR